jgi:FKBP-type peptidyl-prolyl cis-trans isomerase
MHDSSSKLTEEEYKKFPYSKKQKKDLTGDGGVVIRITGEAKANGTLCQEGDIVIVQYVATQGVDGTLFDSSRKHLDRGFKFKLGDRGPKAIIQPGMIRPRGWDIAIKTLCVGQSALIYLSPEYAFGDAGVRHPNRPGFIVPPDAHIMYNMEITGIEKDFKAMTTEELLLSSEKLLTQANERFKEGEYEKASTRYNESLQKLQRIPKIRHDDIPICMEVDQVNGREKIVRCLLNLATCKLKMVEALMKKAATKKSLKKSSMVDAKDLSRAIIRNCTTALNILGHCSTMDISFFAKAFFRRGKSHLFLKNMKEAKKDFTSAFKILPSDKAIRKEYINIKKTLSEKAQEEKKIFKNIIKNSNTALYNDKPEIKKKENQTFGIYVQSIFKLIRTNICSYCCNEKKKKE